jgi:hypothetical protein
MDVQILGMAYAAVLQSPYPAGAGNGHEAAARKVPGIKAVIGSTVEGTQAAKKLLRVTWPNARATTASARVEEFAAVGRDSAARACRTRPRAT